MSSIKQNIKLWLLKNIDLRLFELFNSKYVFTTKIPLRKDKVISDLFPLRIENKWNTHFELLNILKILSPKIDNAKIKKACFVFFNRDGKKLGEHYINILDQTKMTIDLKQICNKLKIFNDGTFAVFHQTDFIDIIKNNSFLTERGYVGYANEDYGPIKAYVHGNFDAISGSDKLELLGVTSFLKKKYHIQYKFNDNFDYELKWVNTSNKLMKIEIYDSFFDKKHTVKIKPGGLKSYICNKEKTNNSRNIFVKSKLNLARPIIFKYMKDSFDVFHG
tara:strand:- start:1483 stop:2310 length:828 start_codon:yes stop_codon:yes gene_type:complete